MRIIRRESTTSTRCCSILPLIFFFGFHLVASCQAGWIDIDTPLDRRTTTSLVDGTVYHLVMSDEFNVENRSFTDGHDPLWTALDRSDDDASEAGGGSMQFYNSSAVTTTEGMLKISTYLETTEWNHYDHVKKEWKHIRKNFTSGMMQSWNKFCFTGGIVEVDIIFPGQPFIGGLWPAVWMLGNLGRATYEASTNMIWPWSFDKCDRTLQPAQTISACNRENHYGMHSYQGRGATEIDIVEAMMGESNGPLPNTKPPISLPYADFTLQVAPGVPNNRPQSGTLPLWKNVISKNGHTEFLAQTWYDGLEMHGNTSINPFFYGTYMDKTKPGEPVTRTEKQAFQADAVGVAHQLTPAHFREPHTFRIEWQPGKGGRLDWFVKGYQINSTTVIEGDGGGQDWIHAFSLKDKSLSDLMGSQIPAEPSYLIMNTAISSTWGFPYDAPDWCPNCYDCDDPKCACNFYPGFCQMLRSGDAAMYIDSIRVYQSRDDSAHVGAPHTLGCDPPEYPTKEWIEGHSYWYMRNPPFVYKDTDPLRKVQMGGGHCDSDEDCGASAQITNLTAIYEARLDGRKLDDGNVTAKGRGTCVSGLYKGIFSMVAQDTVCSCYEGFTGPYCLALDYYDHYPSAKELRLRESPFRRIARFQVPVLLMVITAFMFAALVYVLVHKVADNKRARNEYQRIDISTLKRSIPTPDSNHVGSFQDDSNLSVITGTSI